MGSDQAGTGLLSIPHTASVTGRLAKKKIQLKIFKNSTLFLNLTFIKVICVHSKKEKSMGSSDQAGTGLLSIPHTARLLPAKKKNQLKIFKKLTLF